MTFNLEGDEALSAAIAGLPKIAEPIAAVPTEDRARALEAAEKSYVQTALSLGYDDADAQQWHPLLCCDCDSERASVPQAVQVVDKLPLWSSRPSDPPNPKR